MLKDARGIKKKAHRKKVKDTGSSGSNGSNGSSGLSGLDGLSGLSKFKQVHSCERSDQIMSRVKEIYDLIYSDKHSDIFMPNEIFDDLLTSTLFKNFQERAFAYTWYYLSSYLYRNCVYLKHVDINALNLTNIRTKILGVSGKTLMPIYKKKGVLDQLGYTCSLTDFPVKAVFVNSQLSGFEMFRASIEKANDVIPPQFQIKVPLRGLYAHPPSNYLELIKSKNIGDDDQEILENFNGHFFDVYNTHRISVNAFIACVSHPDLGYKGFYLYCFYRMQNDRFKDGYRITLENLQKIFPINKKTFLKYHKALENLKLLFKENKPNKPNTYKVSLDVPFIEI
jgi:hypothetical protein